MGIRSDGRAAVSFQAGILVNRSRAAMPKIPPMMFSAEERDSVWKLPLGVLVAAGIKLGIKPYEVYAFDSCT